MTQTNSGTYVSSTPGSDSGGQLPANCWTLIVAENGVIHGRMDARVYASSNDTRDPGEAELMSEIRAWDMASDEHLRNMEADLG